MSQSPAARCLLLCVCGLALVGCVDDDPCDNVGGGETACQNQTRVDVTFSDTDPPDLALPDTAPDTRPTGFPYRYVRINDLSPVDESIHGGADIDAIILDKPDGTQAFATTLEGFNHGGGQVEGTELDPNEALGAPDAFSDYTGSDPVCDLEAGFVSLGGDGGYLIVGMGDAIEPGDTITVLEVGGCTGNPGGDEGIIEEILVQVAVGFDVNEQWVSIGQGEGPVMVNPVPTLPIVE